MEIYTITRKAARRWLLRTLQPCQVIVPVMSESLERRLGVVERTKLRLHLLVCAWCARYLKQIKLLRQAISQREFTSADDNASPLKLSDEARQRIFRITS
ncbi:MAG TPA: hypothetical protein VGQ39_12920 [Pyrinomonadaceae bacterium]|nr:hypothetical protein [Pyrinomonadaceae bacterium]